jgi:glycosyltransferase involved in cell wall biosynthesis
MAKELPALRLVGSLLPEQVPQYLHFCDVGLVLFGEHMIEVSRYVCPMKLFEYAAAGLPVVSTPLPIYEELDVPILVVTTKEEAMAAVDEALNQAEESRPALRAFAEKNTWSRRYEEALEIVDALRNGSDARSFA